MKLLDKILKNWQTLTAISSIVILIWIGYDTKNSVEKNSIKVTDNELSIRKLENILIDTNNDLEVLNNNLLNYIELRKEDRERFIEFNRRIDKLMDKK